jgi:hypothetical protein
MKSSSTLSAFIATAFLLTGCSTTTQPQHHLAGNFLKRESIVATSQEKYPPKNPQHIALYPANMDPDKPYKVIGVASVSKYNLVGMQREQKTIHNIMQNLAASIGGDAIMNVTHEDDKVQAKVIAFQKILV